MAWSPPAFGDAVAGCLLGGAVGDALGAVVEFDSLDEIRRRFGPDGLSDFPAEAGPVTDDTQMTLFTAEALIRARRRGRERRFDYAIDELWASYRPPGGGAPGFVGLPVNHSKGCGGVMRVAPVGLVAARPCGLGMASAALTHGHPSGYLSAGAGAEIIAHLRAGEGLRSAVEAAVEAVSPWPDHEETTAALGAALALADREPVPTPEAVATLGEGWVGEEALAIAVYCALTGDSFRAAVLAAANHSGDSDSTAAITGNLLGAAAGRAAVPEAWLAALVERDLVEQVAADLTAAFSDT